MATAREKTLGQIASAWQEFQETLTSVPPERVEDPGLDGQWSVKDIIGHIATWESQMMTLVQRYRDTRDPTVLSFRDDIDGFNERTTREKRALPLDGLLDELHKTHQTVVRFVESLDDTLFDVERVHWRIGVDLYDHYREHGAQISQWLGATGR